jgi:hypothetical protein
MGRVTCKLCGSEEGHEETKLCDRCWELSRRIEADPKLALKVLMQIKGAMADALMPDGYVKAAKTGMSPRQLQELLQDIVDCSPEEGQTEYGGRMERLCPHCGILEWGKPHEDGCPFIIARDVLARKGE